MAVGSLAGLEEHKFRRLIMVRGASGRKKVLLSINSIRHASVVGVALATFELNKTNVGTGECQMTVILHSFAYSIYV